MGLMVLIEAFFKTIHITFMTLIIMIAYCVWSTAKSKNVKYIIIKVVSFIVAGFIIYVITAWSYYLAYQMTFDFPGPRHEFWTVTYVINMLSLLTFALYPNVIERYPHMKKVHIGVYVIAFIAFIL